ncbi:taste receptor type 2 member 41-like [Spea bombifrons]|uniref:taste receptor type 2 member 41-like n=1 Tax=Spea bombifrons TaxID=233779 RepID=UPI00234A9CE2|nr:taste receptor type 2 member 41-like [Spea bombifrons]
MSLNALNIGIIAFDVFALVASIPGNLFIFVNGLGWIQNKKLHVTEHLIFGISVCNLCHGFLKTVSYLNYVLEGPARSVNEIQKYGTVMFLTVMSCNIWFCTWLCVYFCLKIVNINQRMYLGLQRNFNRIFPFLLLKSILGSFLVSLPVALGDTYNATLHDSSETVSVNMLTKIKYLYHLPIHSTISSLAFFLFFGSALTIVISLYRHMKTMQGNAEGSRSPSVEAHVRAAKTVTSLLTLSIIYFPSVLVATLCRWDFNWLHSSSCFISIFHILSSLTLIKGNSKLNMALEKHFPCCPC